MELCFLSGSRGGQGRSFSLVETMVGLAVAGIAASGLFSSFVLGFSIVRISRENARATQVLIEKLEVFRLYSWDQVTNATFVPDFFVAPFATSDSHPGFNYTGNVNIAAVPFSASYTGDMRTVTVAVDWSSGGIPRHREISTYVSRYGVQNYTY